MKKKRENPSLEEHIVLRESLTLHRDTFKLQDENPSLHFKLQGAIEQTLNPQLRRAAHSRRRIDKLRSNCDSGTMQFQAILDSGSFRGRHLNGLS